MRIFSDITNKEYSTVEECVKAEEAYEKGMKAKQEKALALAKEKKEKEEKALATRKADAEKVEEARKTMVEANKAYHKALADFCTKHGSYHRSYHFDGDWNDLWDNFFNSFWF